MINDYNLLEKFGIKDGGKGSVFSRNDGALELLFLNINNVALSIKADTVQAKQCGEPVIEWSLPKTGDLTFESETSSFKQLAASLGSAGLELSNEKVDYYRNETLTYSDSSSLIYELEKTAKDADNVQVHLVTTDGELAKKLSFSLGTDLKTVTINSDSDIAVGDQIRISYTESIASGNAYRFRVPSRSNMASKKLVLDVLGTNVNDRLDAPSYMQFVFHKVKISDGVDITFDSEKASTFQVKMTILSDPTIKISDTQNGFFEVNIPKETDESGVTIPTITDLVATPGDGSATFTFSAPTGATNVNVLYKISTDGSYTPATGLGLTDSSTSASLMSLSTATSYNAKLSFTFNSQTYESNIVTFTTL